MDVSSLKIKLRQHLSYHFGSWTGGLVLINFILFVLISYSSHSLFVPDSRSLISWGAKDPISILQGQWWRFFTPIFLHFGIIHFLLNNLALRVIGLYLEKLIGSGWFITIYIVSGISGNILSTFFNVSIGAGASGSIFGLIGVGMVMEQVFQIKHSGTMRLRVGPFTSMALLNFAIAFIFNFLSFVFDGSIGIDNAAHTGGLLAGIILGVVMFLIRKNPFFIPRYFWGYSILSSFILALVVGAYIPIKTNFLYEKVLREVYKKKNKRAESRTSLIIV